MATLENVVHQAVTRPELLVDQARAAHRLRGGGEREQVVLGAGFHQHGPGGDQRTQVLVLQAAQHAVQDLRAAHVPRHFVALGPRGEVATHHARRHAGVDCRGEERDGAAVGDADHAQTRRVDQRVLLQHVERAPQVPHVLRQRVPAGHGGVDEVRVAGVVVLGVPVQPLAEAAQVGSQDDVAAPHQLQPVVRVGHVGVRQPDDLCLARPMPVTGHDSGTRRLVLTAVGDKQVGGDRHGVLGVEDHLVAAVAVTGRRFEGLDVERDRRGLGTEEIGQAGPPPLQPGRHRLEVRLGERVLVGGGGQAGHPLVPRGVVTGRRVQDESPGVFAHGRPFLAVVWRGGANVGGALRRRRRPGSGRIGR